MSGTAALYWQAYPGYSRQDIADQIDRYATFPNPYTALEDDATPLADMLLAGDPATALPIPTHLRSLTPVPNIATFTPTATLDSPHAVVLVESAYLRAGPGVNYEVIGGAFLDESYPVFGQADNWFQISSPYVNGRAWIAGSLVQIVPDNSIIPAIATPLPPPTVIPPLTPTFLPTWTPDRSIPVEPPISAPIPGVTFVPRTITATFTPTITLTPSATFTPTSTYTASPVPSRTSVPNSAPPNTSIPPAPNPTPVGPTATPFFPLSLYGVNLNTSQSINVREAPNLSASNDVDLLCGDIVFIDGYTPVDTFMWYHLQQGGWVRNDAMPNTYNSRTGAEAAAQRCIPTQPASTPSNNQTPSNATPLPNGSPQPTPAPYVVISFGGAGSYTVGQGCSANIIVTVSGSPATGNMHVKNAWFDSNGLPQGDVYPTTTFPVGSTSYPVGFGGNQPSYYEHEVWFEYNGINSVSIAGHTCANLPTPTP